MLFYREWSGDWRITQFLLLKYGGCWFRDSVPLSGTVHVTDLLFIGFNMFKVTFLKQEFLKAAFFSKQE